MPTPKAIGARELGLPDRAVETLLSVDRDEWMGEADDQERFLAGFGDRLPPELSRELQALRQRLG
jgi:phosphoenolpyruvate carboxykinase (GTP)